MLSHFKFCPSCGYCAINPSLLRKVCQSVLDPHPSPTPMYSDLALMFHFHTISLLLLHSSYTFCHSSFSTALLYSSFFASLPVRRTQGMEDLCKSACWRLQQATNLIYASSQLRMACHTSVQQKDGSRGDALFLRHRLQCHDLVTHVGLSRRFASKILSSSASLLSCSFAYFFAFLFLDFVVSFSVFYAVHIMFRGKRSSGHRIGCL